MKIIIAEGDKFYHRCELGVYGRVFTVGHTAETCDETKVYCASCNQVSDKSNAFLVSLRIRFARYYA